MTDLIEEYIYTFKNLDNEEIKVFLPELEIDDETMKQIKHMSEHSILRNIRLMPDCHKGHGCCVGLTAFIDDKIFPRYVGVDIGCGISMYPLNIKLKKKKIPKIEELIRAKIPMGTEKNSYNQLTEADIKWLTEANTKDLIHLKNRLIEMYPDYKFPEKLDIGYIKQMFLKIGCKFDADIRSIGSLGGGNHYVEINTADAETTENYITVHSGSRHIGLQICAYHQGTVDVSSTPKYLEGHKMIDYLVDMIIGQNLASLNRAIMIRNVVDNLLMTPFNRDAIIETRHNYIDFDRFIMRKGAISAEKDEPCIISLNMKEGILLCKGKGNPDWNYSSAHGCGRILSRSSAGRLNMKVFKKEMEDVYSTCVRKETLDESPMAYRDVDLIKKCITGNVVVLKQLKPLINCKGF
jgi:RNA-splicing ligase RtcB